MKPSNQDEIILYFTETLSALKRIKDIASSKNKTVKIRAIISMLSLTEARIDAGLKYAKAGGKVEFDSTFQQQMYNPIIEWLAGEIA
jgi:hypothetical protein